MAMTKEKVYDRFYLANRTRSEFFGARHTTMITWAASPVAWACSDFGRISEEIHCLYNFLSCSRFCSIAYCVLTGGSVRYYYLVPAIERSIINNLVLSIVIIMYLGTLATIGYWVSRLRKTMSKIMQGRREFILNPWESCQGRHAFDDHRRKHSGLQLGRLILEPGKYIEDCLHIVHKCETRPSSTIHSCSGSFRLAPPR